MPNCSAFLINTSLAPVSSRILCRSVSNRIDKPCSVERRLSSLRLSDNTVHFIARSSSLFLPSNRSVHLLQPPRRHSRSSQLSLSVCQRRYRASQMAHRWCPYTVFGNCARHETIISLTVAPRVYYLLHIVLFTPSHFYMGNAVKHERF